MILTGNCKVCRHERAHEISRRIVRNDPYSEIIADYPDLQLTKPVLSKHKRHIIDEMQTEEVSDHAFVDHLRDVANGLLNKATTGVPLNLVETKIIDAAARAVLGRRMIEDVQEQARAMEDMLAQASKAVWRYEGALEVMSGDRGGAEEGGE